VGGPEKVGIGVVDSDREWPGRFEAERAKIIGLLGDRALAVDDVGSTSVPGRRSERGPGMTGRHAALADAKGQVVEQTMTRALASRAVHHDTEL
jgi:hypothetical protein